MILDSPEKINQIKTETGKKKILYVEDDRNSQYLVEQILRNNYDVDIAPHAKDVLSWVRLKDYDLILMDIKLDDGYSGIDITKKIRTLSNYKDVPILAVTAIAFPDQLKDMVEQGCTDTITKPIDFKLFKSKITNLLSKTQDTGNLSMYL
jgi:CheY-like chemotaxis protein